MPQVPAQPLCPPSTPGPIPGLLARPMGPPYSAAASSWWSLASTHTVVPQTPHTHRASHIPAQTTHLTPLPGPRASYTPAGTACSLLARYTCTACTGPLCVEDRSFYVCPCFLDFHDLQSPEVCSMS